ncbi:MAG: S8 family serine peptidase [Gammaproteobacteria bacterium]|nr:S8 family serine peptidase [Gammaproteobacteria bacterium]
MRAGCAAAVLAGLALLAPALPAATPAGAPRIVVGFANVTHRAPPQAGTTGSYYGGAQSYRVAQNAQQQSRQVAASYALREVASWPIQALAMHCVVYEITDGRSVPEVLAALQRDARVMLAQPLQEFHTLTEGAAVYNDPLFDLQSNLTTLGIPRAHERTQGAGVKVALIDTAVDGAHPDLRGRIIASHSYLPAHAGAGGSLRHGTAMAGLIAAVANNGIGIVGIAPRAQLEVFAACWQLRIDADAAACNTFTLAQALAGALASGAQLVNLSLAGPSDPLLTALIVQGQKRGMVFIGPVAGAGAGFPAEIAGVIAAGGTETTLPAGAFAAPAEHVMTLRPAGEYDFASGNSVATAEVTGVFALLLAAAPHGLGAADVAALLQGGLERTAAGRTTAIDVNAALGQLAAYDRHARVAAGAAP